MKAVILDGHALNPGDLSWAPIEALCDLTVYPRTTPEAIIERTKDAQIVLTNKVVLTKEILEQLPNLKYIGVMATGYNVVDIEAARERNIPVTNIPAYSTDAVAQLVFAFMLEVCHHIGLHTEQVLAGKWTNHPDFAFWSKPLMELAGKTIGIIGFGSIGQAVSKLAKAFKMKVLVYNRTIRPEFEDASLRFVSLDALYQASDFVSLHLPLSKETEGIIHADALKKMKDGAVLINTARGGLIDEEAVYQALESEKLSYACIDVTAVEPIPKDSPLLKAKNIFITPHIGWAPTEARMRLMGILEANLKAFLEGKPINVVNGL